MFARDYKIRIFLVFGFFVLLFLVIIARLFLIQIHQKNFFKTLAQQQYELEIALTPARGIMYDRTKAVPLAFNHDVPSAFIIPNQLMEPEKTKRFLKKQYPAVYKRLLAHPEKCFLWVDRKLDKKTDETLKNRELKDLHFVAEPQRYYPFSSDVQLVGLVDIDNVGTAGLELAFSKHLCGSPSDIIFQKDARSGLFYFNKVVRRQGKTPESLTLSLDNTFQAFAYEALKGSVQELKAKSGGCVVMDADTGHILALANYPSYDPTKKGKNSLESLKNNAVCECYELGSVMKTFCAMAAIEEGVVGLDDLIDCEGRYAVVDGVKVENPTITLLNHLAANNNKISFADVLSYSSNVGIAKVAKRLGPKFYTHLRRLGFGTKTGIQFPGERDGFINPPNRWSRPSVIVMSFGYEMMVSLVQLAKAFSIIANGGYDVTPTLLLDSERPASPKKLYKDTTIEQMKTVLGRVSKKVPIPGYDVMGKTGTARCVKNGRYSAQHHLYSFAGIVEKPGYRRVVVTFIREPDCGRNGLWASDVALPLFKRVAQSMVVRDMISEVTV